MNSQETWDLYERGKDEWNAWANYMLAKRNDLQNHQQWIESAKADFSERMFNGADFSGFIFPGFVNFRKARFDSVTLFTDVSFKKDASFHKAVFEGESHFGGTNATFDGKTDFSNTTFEEYFLFAWIELKNEVSFKCAHFKGDTCFRETKFRYHADFRKTIFEKFAGFDRANFARRALLEEVTFCSHSNFRNVTFENGADFKKSEFKQDADFEESKISGSINFDNASFCGDATFRLVKFKSHASFKDTKFAGDAEFSAIQSHSEFLLDGVEFSKIPNFHQATFAQAPQLNSVKFGPDPNKGVFSRACKAFFSRVRKRQASEWKALEKRGRDIEARCLALMRLAAQGNDREREQLFFRKKCLARRWVIDGLWHLSFWFARLYQLFSDFGRSLSRPLFWLFVGWILCAVTYLCLGSGEANGTACGDMDESKICAAFKLSLSRTLPALWGLSGLGARVQEYSSCLYGREGDTAALLVGLFQSGFSLVMIFLLLLALRNRFRIG